MRAMTMTAKRAMRLAKRAMKTTTTMTTLRRAMLPGIAAGGGAVAWPCEQLAAAGCLQCPAPPPAAAAASLGRPAPPHPTPASSGLCLLSDAALTLPRRRRRDCGQPSSSGCACCTSVRPTSYPGQKDINRCRQRCRPPRLNSLQLGQDRVHTPAPAVCPPWLATLHAPLLRLRPPLQHQHLHRLRRAPPDPARETARASPVGRGRAGRDGTGNRVAASLTALPAGVTPAAA